jgi:hypothetical protein
VKLGPRAQLRRDLNTGKVKQQPRTEEEKAAARAQRKRDRLEAFERKHEDKHEGEADDGE